VRVDQIFEALLKIFLRYPNFNTVLPMSDQETQLNRNLINSIFLFDMPKMIPRHFLTEEGSFIDRSFANNIFLVEEHNISKVIFVSEF
jgi:SHS2 domain-containing protein